MNPPNITKISEVIETLEDIVMESEKNSDPRGYFAALYLKVTKAVRDGIDNKEFQNNERMERLDVIFAKRYINAYYNSGTGIPPITESWALAFDLDTKYWPIVLQHLLIGMNAHINLDLGIAAAEVMKGQNIKDLKQDFDKINTILASLVNDVEQDLSKIWPTLGKLLKLTKRVDNFLINFSMSLARDGAWRFATYLSNADPDSWHTAINNRDLKVAKKAQIITSPGWFASLILAIIRLGEKGSVYDKIQDLKQ